MRTTSFIVSVKEADPLDWPARMRAIMGTAYGLQYMHDLNPPVPHSNLNSNAIFLTDDYAAKVCAIFTNIYIYIYSLSNFPNVYMSRRLSPENLFYHIQLRDLFLLYFILM